MNGNTATEKAFALLTAPADDFGSHNGLIPWSLLLEMLPLKNLSRISVFTEWGLLDVSREDIIYHTKYRAERFRKREEKDGIKILVNVYMRKETNKKTMYTLNIGDARYQKEDGEWYIAP